MKLVRVTNVEVVDEATAETSILSIPTPEYDNPTVFIDDYTLGRSHGLSLQDARDWLANRARNTDAPSTVQIVDPGNYWKDDWME